MICHDPTCLYIHYLGKVYEENEWRKHCDVTAQLYRNVSQAVRLLIGWLLTDGRVLRQAEQRQVPVVAVRSIIKEIGGKVCLYCGTDTKHN